MYGVSQDEFLDTIRRALAERGDPVDLPADREVARVVQPTDDLVKRFCAMATDAKMHVHALADESAVVPTLLTLLNELEARRIVCAAEPFPQRDALLAALPGAGVDVLPLAERDAAFEADVGITPVRLAIAETGSLVVSSGPRTSRMSSIAVPTHVAIVRREQIVPDLLDWTATLAAGLAANEVLVTGPSKTADIEMNLVWGVHGPRSVHILLIES